jgi:hypothetical protein
LCLLKNKFWLMNSNFQKIILSSTGAQSFHEIEVIQSLWSGYGKIVRLALQGADRSQIVVKHVRLPQQTKHPRGWNTDLSHDRKVHSYQVETAWYADWSMQCDERCRTPQCLALESQGDEVLIVLEDLDASGFPARLTSVSMTEIETCLSWLANFHATFMGQQPAGLWQVGTYWHLATRPDELAVLSDADLKKAASEIDRKLQSSPFQTFVHGDAKLANFCFSEDGKQVAAVDFQYVGGGCGMKDVVYFIGSCLRENECQRWEQQLLNFYFDALAEALQIHHHTIDTDEVEKNWRALYPVAWTDFHRFLKGWSPGHWKINSYSEQLTREVLAQLQTDKLL